LIQIKAFHKAHGGGDMKNYGSFLLRCFSILAIIGNVSAQQYNPQPGWKDSYAVGGRCYCDSNGFDHGLDTKTAPTPFGSKNVVAICADITRVLGVGPLDGRIPYNDIQCGNGPANDAADESGCPGRVDIGPEGCNQIGPTWDLMSVYGNAPNTRLDRSQWTLSASSNTALLQNAIDASTDSRWSTGATQASGQFFQIDLGALRPFNRIVIDAALNPEDYPRAFRMLVSDDGLYWRSPIFSGQGFRSLTDVYFVTQAARYVRIELTGASLDRWWSIHDIALYQTEDPTISRPVLDSRGWIFGASSSVTDAPLAIDGSAATRWTTKTVQKPGQFFQIDLQRAEFFDGIQLDTRANPNDYPRGYQVLVSDDGVLWRGPVASGVGDGPVTGIRFPVQKARYVRIEQTGSDAARWWSIHEVFVEKAFKRTLRSNPLPPNPANNAALPQRSMPAISTTRTAARAAAPSAIDASEGTLRESER
jgi:F5/8 type C domain